MIKQYEKGLTKDQVILKYLSSKVDINEAVVIPDMGKQYENELNSAEDDHMGSLSNYNSRTVRQINIKIIQQG